jgi:hypothetical protein
VADKRVTKLIRDAQGWPGWRVETTKSGWTLYPPDKDQAGITVHGSESDHRAWKNTVARLKRAGAPIT